jgi:uncharacterized protein (UPF0147 family)
MKLPHYYKELDLISKNLSLLIKNDDKSEKLLKNMDLTVEDISNQLRNSLLKTSKLLLNERTITSDKIDRAVKILKEIYDNSETPLKIRELIINSAIERLINVKKELMVSDTSIVAGVIKFQPTLDLLILDDNKTIQMRNKLGINEVSPVIREAAIKAKLTLEDKSLDKKERTNKATDILAETLQPAYYGGRNPPSYSNELKTILWEIAHTISHQNTN